MATVFEMVAANATRRVQARQVQAQIRPLLQAEQLTQSQFELLAAVDAPAALGTLAERLCCSCGNLTGVADRLERSGLIARVRSTADRRVVHVVRTPAGDAALARLKAAMA